MDGFSPLCPYLEHIRIIFKEIDFYGGFTRPHDNFTRITIHALLTFLESRVQMKTLQSCDVFFPGPPAECTEEDLRRIQVLLDSGLKLRIQYGKLYPVRPNDWPSKGLWISRSGLEVMTAEGTVLSDMEGIHGAGILA